VPGLMAEALKHEPEVEALAREALEGPDVLYLGRGTSYPLALEGALKLKEISYIHAEGYAAGELKHGPIALIDETMPVIVIAPHDAGVREDRLEHAGGRGPRRPDHPDHRRQGAPGRHSRHRPTIVLPAMAPNFAPIVYAVPIQLLAYHTAVVIGKDVDQPRNLAKSVTVE
jgi:glucosamine--fructose-6-phosphate aminotransferase (isomerizing)